MATVDDVQTAGTGWVGRRVPRQEDTRLVTGTGTFADDDLPQGALHCAILRSPHPHARIVRVDVSKAREMPGVELAISGAEAREHWSPLPLNFDLPDMKTPEVWGMAVDKVAFEGEPVAAVAASSRYLAEDALEAIEVEYEVLAPVMVFDEVGAGWGEPGAEPPPPIYDGWDDNVQFSWDFSYGDVDGAFAEADVVVSERVSVHRYGAVPMEPRATVADFDARRRTLTLRLSTQFPHQMKFQYARVFGLPETSIRVVTGDVGGGYGAKGTVDADVIPVLLSILTGRPVKWAETREEWLLAGPAGSRGYTHNAELALRSDGTVLGLRDRLLGDLGCEGAARAIGGAALVVASFYIPGPYRIEAFDVKVRGGVTNKPAYGAYRGYGKDIANQVIERLMDSAADALGMDPLEIRRRNLVDEYPHTMCTGPIIESGSFAECLDLLEEKMDLPALRAEQERALEDGRHLGLALVTTLEPSAGAIPMSMFAGYESATVRLHPDGTATLLSGLQPIGQGIQTSYAQVVADCLGLSPDDVRVRWGDTDVIPYGLGAYASRGATFGVSAALEAGMEVRRKLLIAAGVLLEAAPEDLQAADGHVSVKGSPDKRIPIADVSQATYFFPGPYAMLPGEKDAVLEASSVYTNPNVTWTPDEHGRVRIYPTHASGAMGALVEVDAETGKVVVQRIWYVHDAGRIINPAIAEGQLLGSTIQAFGGTMFEQYAYGEDGRALTRTLTDYQLPNGASIPQIDLFHIETLSPVTPLGTKGLGEGGHIGVGAVLVAAVEDALRPYGVKVNHTPLTPNRVLDLIDAAGAEG
ncbi:MAG: aerobic carbon-monoxide dehydrogenase large subunit [Solirubrobacteraceae bacterium]|jgi:carbon-monoxide dehydrogenase large subunit|nr:aerobic carbon-monoxide dehydrogenase large subunit [Solirubrobacteraceae bacterium]